MNKHEQTIINEHHKEIPNMNEHESNKQTQTNIDSDVVVF